MARMHVGEYRRKVKYWTGVVLRDYPHLRTVKARRLLVEKVWEVSGVRFNPETITRSARQLQNSMGLYLPECDDNREMLEEEARMYYGGRC